MAKPFILNRPLYTDETKTKVLEEGDPEAAFVIGGKGSTVPPDEVEKYGLDESHRLIEEDEGDGDAEPVAVSTITTESGFEPAHKPATSRRQKR
jgi:hypothetical protein